MISCCNSRRIKHNDSPKRQKSKQRAKSSEICPKYNHEKWIEIMKKPVDPNTFSELSYNLRHNFPWNFRKAIWYWLCEKGRTKGLYQKLLQIESSSLEQIQKDLSRSFHQRGSKQKNSSKGSSESSDQASIYSIEIIMNEEQKRKKLQNILIAYSNLDKEVEYVQGMNFIAVSIIQQIEQEELCFIIFNYILNILNYRKVFLMDLKILDVIEKRIQFEVPLIYQRMIQIKVTSIQCFDYLIFSLFQLSRKELAIRIIDIFLLEKESIIQTVIIQLLKIQQFEILKCEDQDSFIEYMRNDLIDEALDKLDDRIDFITQLLSIGI